MYHGSAVYSDSNGEPCGKHHVTDRERLQYSSLLIYAYRRDTCGHDLCMGSAYTGPSPDRRRIRYSTEYSDQYTDQYDSQCSDGDLQRDTFIGYLFAGRSIYGDDDGEPGSDDHCAEHEHLYDDTVHLFTYCIGGQPAYGHYLCMEHTDRGQHIRQRRPGIRPEYTE
jgi:hypothetical protein